MVSLKNLTAFALCFAATFQTVRAALPRLRPIRATEETGYSAQSWRKLTAILPSPGILDERLHLYAAWDLVPGSSRPEAD